LERARDTALAISVFSEEVAGKAEGDTIGELDSLFFSGEAEARDERTESLILEAKHIRSAVHENSGKEILGFLQILIFRGPSLTTTEDLSALADSILDMSLDLLNGSRIDKRTDLDALIHTVAHLQCRNGFSHLFGKSVVNAGMHQETVRRDASLSSIAHLAHHGLLHSQLDIRIIEDDEGSVTAQLHRHALHGAGSLLQEELADASRAGEGDLLDEGVAGELFTDLLRLAAHDVEDTSRNTSLLSKDSARQSGVRGQLGGLHDEGAASDEGSSSLAGDHSRREVPGRDSANHADRILLSDHHHRVLDCGGLEDFAVQQLSAVLAVELEEASSVCDLTHSLSPRLALLDGEDLTQVLLVLHHQVAPALDDSTALGNGSCSPLSFSCRGGIDGGDDILCTAVRDGAHKFMVAGVNHLHTRMKEKTRWIESECVSEQGGGILEGLKTYINSLGALSIDKLVINEVLVLEKRSILQFHGEFCSRHHTKGLESRRGHTNTKTTD